MCRARASKAAVKLGTTLATGTSTGPIALRNSLEKTIAFSPSLTETGPRVRSLHRDFIRSVPWIKRAYGVTFTEQVRALSLFSSRFARSPNKFLSPTQKMRSLLTQAFKDKSTTTDVTTINRLIVMGRWWRWLGWRWIWRRWRARLGFFGGREGDEDDKH